MQEKLEICKEICAQVTNQTISTNDIFPYRGFNVSFISLLFTVKKHGIETLNQYLAYFSHCNQVRKTIAELSKKLTLFTPDQIRLIKYLSMLKMGIGESDVLSHGVSYQLLKNHPSLETAVISIENYQQNRHYLILLSNSLPRENDDLESALLQLPCDAIIIDPYLHFVNAASLYKSENSAFLEMHQFQRISSIQCKPILSIEEQRTIESQAQNLCKKLTSDTKSCPDPIASLRGSFFPDAPIPQIPDMITKKQERQSILSKDEAIMNPTRRNLC